MAKCKDCGRDAPNAVGLPANWSVKGKYPIGKEYFCPDCAKKEINLNLSVRCKGELQKDCFLAKEAKH